VYRAVEGAEDDRERGAADIHATQVGAQDVVVLLAASGSTPYVLGALHAARAAGALTIGIANNPGADLATGAEVGITLDTGPEVISGSTRLKAGTAQKIALNTLSSALMVRLNKVYGNLMVNVQPKNEKLVDRARRIIMKATGATPERAMDLLNESGMRVRTAIVMGKAGVNRDEAERRLSASGGRVRRALGE